MSKDAAIGEFGLEFYANDARQVLKSHLGANPYTARMYRRPGINEDLWFQPQLEHN